MTVGMGRRKGPYPETDGVDQKRTPRQNSRNGADSGNRPADNGDSRDVSWNDLSVSGVRGKTDKKTAIFKHKYNRSFDYGNSYHKNMAQKGNDLVYRNQNLIEKNRAISKASNGPQTTPPKIPEKKSSQRIPVNHQTEGNVGDANIFSTGNNGTRNGFNKSSLSDTDRQIAFNNGNLGNNLHKVSKAPTAFETNSEFEGLANLDAGQDLLKDEQDTIMTGNDGYEKCDSVMSKTGAKSMDRSISLGQNNEKLQPYKKIRKVGEEKEKSKRS